MLGHSYVRPDVVGPFERARINQRLAAGGSIAFDPTIDLLPAHARKPQRTGGWGMMHQAYLSICAPCSALPPPVLPQAAASLPNGPPPALLLKTAGVVRRKVARAHPHAPGAWPGTRWAVCLFCLLLLFAGACVCFFGDCRAFLQPF